MATIETAEWIEEELPQVVADSWRANLGKDASLPRYHTCGGLRALSGREPVVPGDFRWHVSVSREDRIPVWAELVSAAHNLRPGVAFVVGIPPLSWWLNFHPFVMHLWETNDLHLIAEWRRNARGDRPS